MYNSSKEVYRGIWISFFWIVSCGTTSGNPRKWTQARAGQGRTPWARQRRWRAARGTAGLGAVCVWRWCWRSTRGRCARRAASPQGSRRERRGETRQRPRCCGIGARLMLARTRRRRCNRLPRRRPRCRRQLQRRPRRPRLPRATTLPGTSPRPTSAAPPIIGTFASSNHCQQAQSQTKDSQMSANGKGIVGASKRDASAGPWTACSHAATMRATRQEIAKEASAASVCPRLALFFPIYQTHQGTGQLV